MHKNKENDIQYITEESVFGLVTMLLIGCINLLIDKDFVQFFYLWIFITIAPFVLTFQWVHIDNKKIFFISLINYKRFFSESIEYKDITYIRIVQARTHFSLSYEINYRRMDKTMKTHVKVPNSEKNRNMVKQLLKKQNITIDEI